MYEEDELNGVSRHIRLTSTRLHRVEEHLDSLQARIDALERTLESLTHQIGEQKGCAHGRPDSRRT